jgi:dTDP-glucose pyrophosphorylase
MRDMIFTRGSGIRIYLPTSVASMQFLPVYAKSIVYYPLSTLVISGMHFISIISMLMGYIKLRAVLKQYLTVQNLVLVCDTAWVQRF